MSIVIKPSALKELLSTKASKVAVVDSSWLAPPLGRNAFEEYKQKRIPSAVFFDISKIRAFSPFPFMLPSEPLFKKAIDDLKIPKDAHVVVYDTAPLLSAPRGVFTFKAYGFDNVSVLDGGLPAWEKDGFDVQSSSSEETSLSSKLYETLPPFGPDDKLYEAAKKVPAVVDYDEIVANAKLPFDKASVILDARPVEAFDAGHIPHSFPVPASSVLTGDSIKTFLAPADLEALFSKVLGAELWAAVKSGEKPVITSCQGGLTAAITWTALQIAGVPSPRLYDESWAGYSSRESSIIEKS